MKAKDYFEKYRPLLYDVPNGFRLTLKSGKEISMPRSVDELNGIIADMANEFIDEFNVMKDKRKIRIPSAFKSLIEEFNDKWNALSELFVKEYGEHILKRNGFRIMVLKSNPILKPLYGLEEEKKEEETPCM